VRRCLQTASAPHRSQKPGHAQHDDQATRQRPARIGAQPDVVIIEVSGRWYPLRPAPYR
jgi:hypothetical protein